ncbi:MAG TPA: replicative DNA helicase [Myxococcaceae bacterium]|nr:replicative DNA helicase [Myxococcaceae bacterium]
MSGAQGWADVKRATEDLSAERAVLGALLADSSLMNEVAEVLAPEDFSTQAHEAIYEAMRALELNQRKVDHLTLAEELKVRGKLAGVGGPAYLMGLDQVVPLAQNAREYAELVKDKALRRRVVDAARGIIELASSEVGETDALLDEAERRMFLVAEKKREGDLLPVRELMDRTLELLDKMRMSSSGITGLSTGYIDLDHQLTGLHPGELLILAARPGMGKTSLAMNMALHCAMKEKRPAAIFSLEMPSEQLLMRLLSSAARVDMKKLRGGRLTPNDEERLTEIAGTLFEAPLYIDDTGSLSPFDLRAKLRRLKQKSGDLGLVVIDYLQLMSMKNRSESRQLEISEISRALKQLSKELEVPVLALSQLSRKVEERKGGKPMLSDLRESGAIEQDADVVMFIHREDTGDEEGDGGVRPSAIPVELIVAKQRNGPIGSVDLIFLGEFTRFESRAGNRGDGN